MARDRACGNSSMAVLLQNDRIPCDSLWIPSSSTTLNGAKSMVNFDNVGEKDTTSTPFLHSLVKEENGDEDFDVCLSPPGKKRRLTATQVQFLEKSFEVENKLDPERKIQLAKDLGLQPRQVAIWFQNRRARYKNKQLEKDYDSLQASYDWLKADYDALLKEKENLKNQVVCLKEKLLVTLTESENPETHEAVDSQNADFQKLNAVSEIVSHVPVVTPKQEDVSSAKSDVFDSDSPRSFLEPADSSNVLEPDQSDFSQDEEDHLRRSFLPQSYFPKVCHDPHANSCNFEFPMDDQPIWSGLAELSYGL